MPLDSWLEAFKETHLLVVGDVMLDRYIGGSICRISPEAPVPVLKKEYTNERLGGAGNVARAVHALGGRVTLLTFTAQDASGQKVRHLLEPIAGTTTVPLVFTDQRPTSTKTRLMAKQQQMLRIDDEATAFLNPQDESALRAAFDHVLPYVQGIVLSDYNKGVLTPAVCRYIIAQGQKKGLPVFVDPKGDSFEKYHGATWITPNFSELKAVSPGLKDTDQHIQETARALMLKHQIQGILVTRSEKGMNVITANIHQHLPAHVVDVFDVTGAGDTVIALFSLSIAAGLDPIDAADLSNHGAAVAVSKAGAATVSPQELLMHKNNPCAPCQKIFDPQEAENIVFQWRAHGLTIGFTNGCFDILHPGHVALLKKAKSFCDRLIVAVNTDASVSRLKGSTRPVHDLNHRMQVLEGVSWVDGLVAFDEDTPLEIIKKLRPHVLCKGADYQLEQVVGSQEVFSWGGRVELIPLVSGYSTTSTVKKLSG